MVGHGLGQVLVLRCGLEDMVPYGYMVTWFSMVLFCSPWLSSSKNLLVADRFLFCNFFKV